MSSLTNFLKLFKWDTKTDGSQKFNIDKALNDNWDKVETNAKAVDDTLKTKSDKKYKSKTIKTVGWYRIAKISRSTTSAYANSIINLHTMWNSVAPQGITFIATAMGNERKITILSSNTPYQFTKLRIVTETDDEGNGTGYEYVEAYYKLATNNNVFVQIFDDDAGIEAIEFEEAVEENEIERVVYNITSYDVNGAIGTLSSLTTTNKTSLVNALNEVNNKKINIITGTEYATSEYIDDKQVYRKRINIGALPNATSKTVEHGLSKVRFVKMPQGYATNSNGLCLALPFSNPTSTNNVSLSVNGSSILIFTGTDRSQYSGYVDLYYTK